MEPFDLLIFSNVCLCSIAERLSGLGSGPNVCIVRDMKFEVFFSLELLRSMISGSLVFSQCLNRNVLKRNSMRPWEDWPAVLSNIFFRSKLVLVWRVVAMAPTFGRSFSSPALRETSFTVVSGERSANSHLDFKNEK